MRQRLQVLFRTAADSSRGSLTLWFVQLSLAGGGQGPGGLLVAVRWECCQLLEHSLVYLRELVLGKLDRTRQHSVLLGHTTTLSLHRSCVDLVPLPHVRVLLTALLEGLATAHDWTCKGLLTSMDPQVVVKCAHRQAAAATVLAHVHALLLADLLLIAHRNEIRRLELLLRLRMVGLVQDRSIERWWRHWCRGRAFDCLLQWRQVGR